MGGEDGGKHHEIRRRARGAPRAIQRRAPADLPDALHASRRPSSLTALALAPSHVTALHGAGHPKGKNKAMQIIMDVNPARLGCSE